MILKPITKSPLWERMAKADNVGCAEELQKVRGLLSASPDINLALQEFLYARWCELNSHARIEMTLQIKEVFRSTADAYAELAGILFENTQPKTEQRVPIIR